MQLHKVLYCVLAMSDQNMSLISSPDLGALTNYFEKINFIMTLGGVRVVH